MTLSRIVLIFAAAPVVTGISIATGEPAKIYACKDAQGNVVYQDDPCLEAALATSKPGPPAEQKPPPRPTPKTATKPRGSAVPPAAPGRPADARWATPETTLRTFLRAIEAGDRGSVLSCLTSSALADLGPGVESLPLERLRETVHSFTEFVSEGDLGPYWAIRALRAGNRPKWIFFEKTSSGDWKIGAF